MNDMEEERFATDTHQIEQSRILREFVSCWEIFRFD